MRVFEFVLEGVVVRVEVFEGEKDPVLDLVGVDERVAVGDRDGVCDDVIDEVDVRVGLEP